MKLNFFSYMGGKYYVTDTIVGLLDYSKDYYIELFGGSGKVLLNKPPHKIELFNDIDSNIFNLFNVIKNNYDEFVKKIEYLLYIEKQFYFFRDNMETIEDPIEKAIATYYVLNCSFSGVVDSSSYSFMKNKAKGLYCKLGTLYLIHSRLKNVQILNKDYKRILDSISDKDDIMLYADPPYYGTEYYYKNGTFTKDDHCRLAEYLNNAKYSVLLSYYPFDGIEELYPKDKWEYVEVKVVKHSYGLTKHAKNNDKPKAIELLIGNYDISELKFVDLDFEIWDYM